MRILAILLLIPSIAFANIKDMKNTIVLIETRDNSQGSGVVISPNGLIITAAHVLEDRRSATVYIKNKPYKAITAYIDKENDISLLKIEAKGLKHAKIANNYKEKEEVYSISNPLGQREVYNKGKITEDNLTCLTSTNIVDNGSSGGAIFNKKGELISIITNEVILYDTAVSVPMRDFKGILDLYINNLI